MERSCERIPLLRFDGGISILRTIALASRIPKLAILVSNSRVVLMPGNLSRTPRNIDKQPESLPKVSRD